MRTEFDPQNIRFRSDRVGFDGLRALVRETPDEHESGSGRQGLSFFMFACRPVREKGRTLLTFAEDPEKVVTCNRVSTIVPPNKPFVISWHRAAGRVGEFDVHPHFFEEVLRRSGLPASGFHSAPTPRFVINRRIDWLCQLLMEETEQGCPSGRLYFEHLATALLMAVLLQTDPRLPDAGNIDAQQRRIQRAVTLMETNFASKLTRDEVARAAGLSPSHFSQLFHSVVGLSPHQYLLRCRLRHAQRLLSTVEGGLSIADVAAESGFADQAHLARHFRGAYGVSPLQFRQSKVAF
jgi:AraC-like DNA-binding protein